MITETLMKSPAGRVPATAAYVLKLLAGPVAFAIVLLLPLALSYEGRVALATFACAIVLWITRPSSTHPGTPCFSSRGRLR